MSAHLAEKQVLIDEIHQVSQDAPSMIALQYRGMKSNELNLFRKEARELNVFTRVVKNTLARRAFKNTPYESCSDAMDGPNILLFALLLLSIIVFLSNF